MFAARLPDVAAPSPGVETPCSLHAVPGGTLLVPAGRIEKSTLFQRWAGVGLG